MVEMLLKASTRVIARDFPNKLQELSDIATECSTAGNACHEDFRRLSGLAGLSLLLYRDARYPLTDSQAN
jgi:hypothetical protein